MGRQERHDRQDEQDQRDQLRGESETTGLVVKLGASGTTRWAVAFGHRAGAARTDQVLTAHAVAPSPVRPQGHTVGRRLFTVRPLTGYDHLVT